MKEGTLYIVSNYLKSYGYGNISKKEIKKRIYSDSDNDILSVSNTLDYFKIKNLVANVPKESLMQLPGSFIAQVRNKISLSLVLVKKISNQNLEIIVDKTTHFSMSIENFLNDWTGLIIAIEKSRQKKQSFLNYNVTKFSLITAITTLSIVYILLSSTPFNLLYYLLSIIGFVFSYLIVFEKLGTKTILSRFCTISNNTDCQSVLGSKESRIFNFIDLEDISIIYFSTIVVITLFEPKSTLIIYSSFFSLPIVLYSLYHQYFTIKKWCPLCLGVAVVLVLQFFVLIYNFDSLIIEYNIEAIIGTILSTFLVIGFWFYFKPLLSARFENETLEIENLSFKRNHRLFMSYYNSIEAIETNSDIIPDICFGKQDALITFLVITNPLCEMCFEAHSVLMNLLQKHPDKIQLKIRFFVPFDDRNDPRTFISERLLDLYFSERENFKEAYQNWYSKVKIKDWIEKWDVCKNSKMSQILKTHKNWCIDNSINYTPSIVINGKLFPDFYSPKDIEHFIDKLIELEQTNTKEIKNIHA